jgi:anti-anti-sigma regulatory factor
VADHVVLAPIIGHLDARRIEQVRQRLLNSATQRMHTVILDLSGMTTLSEKIVRDLIQIVQALRLQGVSVLVCGISADLALPLSNFGTQLQGIQVVGTVQEAIQTATLLTRQVNLRAS